VSILVLGLAIGGLLLLLSLGVPHDDDRLGLKARERARARLRLHVTAVLAVLAALCFAAFRVVPGGTVGVQTLFGRICDSVLTQGLNAVNALEQVRLLSVRTHELFEQADVPSREGLTMGPEVSALYHLEASAAPSVVRTLGAEYERVFMVPALRPVIRGATVNHEAKDLYASGREVIAQEIQEALPELLAERGIVLERVLLRKIVLPDMVQEAIDPKLGAEQEAQRMRFVLQKETQEAERKRVEATGIAGFQRIVSQGISGSLLKWKAIEVASELPKSPNTKLVRLGDKSGLPIILGDP
jgi:regulator of protease activity HflC (stomatin/prohibitin superfamily)